MIEIFYEGYALYPATDSGYRIQWGTYGVIVKMAGATRHSLYFKDSR